MSKKKNGTVWSIPVPKTLDNAVEMCVELDTYVSKSDFVRGACQKELSLGDKLAAWRKAKELEILEAYKKVLEGAGCKELHICAQIPECGEIDLLGALENGSDTFGVICELKEPKPGGWTTFDYARRTYFIEEQPAAQVDRKLKKLESSKRAQKTFTALTKLEKFSEAFVLLVIVTGIPLPYTGDIPELSIYDNPETIKKKILQYLECPRRR